MTATWNVYGINEMMRSCEETASSSSLAEVTSTDLGAAFSRSPHNCLALASVRQAACKISQIRSHTDGDMVFGISGEVIEGWFGYKA